MRIETGILFRAVCLGLVSAGAGGCLSASAPDYRYWTVDMSSSGSAAPRTCNLHVEGIRCSSALASNEILIKVGPTRAEYYALDQWIAPLEELVAEKLGAEFGPIEQDRPTTFLRGVLLAFEQVDLPDGGAEAHIKLEVELRPTGPEGVPGVPLHKIYETRLPASERSAEAVVSALSEGLTRIAAEIARDADGR
jgi:ABC-type uncharacterized transport system auxiliary subunit